MGRGGSEGRNRQTSTMPQKISDVSYDDLPEELKKSILIKLSPRDLLVCVRVCRSWRAIIGDDPTFPYMHLQHSRQASISHHNAGLIILSADDFGAFTCCLRHSDEFGRQRIVTFGDTSYLVVTSCDGLFLLSTTPNLEGRMILWNPAVGKVKLVPNRRDLYPRQRDLVMGMGCIEYDDKHDYKILQLYYLYPSKFPPFPEHTDENTRVMVYSLSSHSWRRIEAFPPSHACSQDSGVFINDSVHWPAQTKGGHMVILGFDLREEVFWEVEMPPSDSLHNSYRCFVAEFRGLLSICIQYQKEEAMGLYFVEIWVMKEPRVASSWSKLFVHGPTRFLEAVGFMKNGKVLWERKFDRVVGTPILPDGSITYLESLTLLDDNQDTCNDTALERMCFWVKSSWYNSNILNYTRKLVVYF